MGVYVAIYSRVGFNGDSHLTPYTSHLLGACTHARIVTDMQQIQLLNVLFQPPALAENAAVIRPERARFREA